MSKFFISISENRDGLLYVLEARDVQGNFLGVVSEPTRSAARRELKMVAIECLSDMADQGKNPLDYIFREKPSTTCLQFSINDLSRITLIYSNRVSKNISTNNREIYQQNEIRTRPLGSKDLSISQSKISVRGTVLIPRTIMKKANLTPGDLLTWEVRNGLISLIKLNKFNLEDVKQALKVSHESRASEEIIRKSVIAKLTNKAKNR